MTVANQAGAAGNLDVHRLTSSYGQEPVLVDVTFSTGPGSILGIVGPNGAGKSTLLKAMVGLADVQAGHVRVAGTLASDVLNQIAYLPQRPTVDWDFPAVVRDVVAMGRAPHLGRLGRPRKHDRASVTEALKRLGLSTLAERPICELSGGQRQRVFLARALAQEATILLLDEPFAGVDAVTETLLWDELARLAAANCIVVLVNHDLAGVLERCDSLLLLAGQAIACGSPRVVGTPDNLLRTYGALPRTQRSTPDERSGGTRR